MKHAKHIRGYIAPVPGLSVETQRRMADDFGCSVVFEHGETRGIDARHQWLLKMRPGDVAWVPDLRVLVRRARDLNGVRPSADVASVLAAVPATGAVLVEARTGIRSDSREWPARVAELVGRVNSIHRSRRKALASARKARAARPLGIVTRYKADPEFLKRWGPVWRDPRHATAEAARDALPEELRGLSIASLYRLFEGRRPGDPSAGGRGMKRKKLIEAEQRADQRLGRPPTITPKVEAEIEELIAAGESVRDISARYGVVTHTVRRRFNRKRLREIRARAKSAQQ